MRSQTQAGAEKQALADVARIFAMPAACAAILMTGPAIRGLMCLAFLLIRPGAAGRDFFLRGLSKAAPAHRQPDAEGEEESGEPDGHGDLGGTRHAGRSK